MKPNWKAATKAEVDEIEREHREWHESDADANAPDMPTWKIMGLVLRIRSLERQVERLKKLGN